MSFRKVFKSSSHCLLKSITDLGSYVSESNFTFDKAFQNTRMLREGILNKLGLYCIRGFGLKLFQYSFSVGQEVCFMWDIIF